MEKSVKWDKKQNDNDCEKVLCERKSKKNNRDETEAKF